MTGGLRFGINKDGLGDAPNSVAKRTTEGWLILEEETEVSWKVVGPGTPVRSSDGTVVGEVTHVLGDPDEDIFDGVGFRRGFFGAHRMASWKRIERITDRAVYLNIDAAQAEQAPAYQEEHIYMVGVTGFFRHHPGWREANRF